MTTHSGAPISRSETLTVFGQKATPKLHDLDPSSSLPNPISHDALRQFVRGGFGQSVSDTSLNDAHSRATLRKRVEAVRKGPPPRPRIQSDVPLPQWVKTVIASYAHLKKEWRRKMGSRAGHIVRAAIKSLILFAAAWSRYHREKKSIHPLLLAATCLTPFVRAACDWVFDPSSGWLEWLNYMERSGDEWKVPEDSNNDIRRFYCGLERHMVQSEVQWRRPTDQSILAFAFQRLFGTMNPEHIGLLRNSYEFQTGKGGALRVIRECLLTASVAVVRGESLLFEARASFREMNNVPFAMKLVAGFLPFFWGRNDWEYFIELLLDYSGKSI